ncbi:heteromeric transposase endonuclease subunit TnsA [Halalkalibacillus sediminis]|uniref:Heteromeric transposase endonuclease subunit TnsA n=1 Tax=Halalkalibacillus sediminis TaxID=2018042 RepID=A0A2I0QTD6_9BACI|nr:heteromeric transposase endonuclease subunit TnsA [Halalkalibacillus sediminis]
MSKRKMGWSEKKIERYISEGRGQGELKDYKPWLTTQSFSTKGNSPRLHGWKTDRMHEYFSDLEKFYFFILEWSEKVIDIREQYPILDRAMTADIAAELGAKHPCDHSTDCFIPFTTDFMITVVSRGKKTFLARQVKPSSQLEDPRVIEKFEIEAEYWYQKGINWAIVTEKDISTPLAKNIMNVHKYFHLENQEHEEDAQRLVKYLVEKKNTNGYWNLIDLADQFDELNNSSMGTSLNYIRHLIATKKISIDMYKNFVPRNVLLEEVEIPDQVLYKGEINNGFIS